MTIIFFKKHHPDQIKIRQVFREWKTNLVKSLSINIDFSDLEDEPVIPNDYFLF